MRHLFFFTFETFHITPLTFEFMRDFMLEVTLWISALCLFFCKLNCVVLENVSFLKQSALQRSDRRALSGISNFDGFHNGRFCQSIVVRNLIKGVMSSLL